MNIPFVHVQVCPCYIMLITRATLHYVTRQLRVGVVTSVHLLIDHAQWTGVGV